MDTTWALSKRMEILRILAALEISPTKLHSENGRLTFRSSKVGIREFQKRLKQIGIEMQPLPRRSDLKREFEFLLIGSQMQIASPKAKPLEVFAAYAQATEEAERIIDLHRAVLPQIRVLGSIFATKLKSSASSDSVFERLSELIKALEALTVEDLK